MVGGLGVWWNWGDVSLCSWDGDEIDEIGEIASRLNKCSRALWKCGSLM